MANDAQIATSLAPHADHCRSDSVAHAPRSDLLPSHIDSTDRCGIAICQRRRLGSNDSSACADGRDLESCLEATITHDEASATATVGVGSYRPATDLRRRKSDAAGLGDGDGESQDNGSDESRTEPDRSHCSRPGRRTDESLRIRRPISIASSPSWTDDYDIATNLKPLKFLRGCRDIDRLWCSETRDDGIIEHCYLERGQPDLEFQGGGTCVEETTTAVVSVNLLRNEEAEEEESECVTPTGAQFRIPEPRICPPAPRKKRQPPKRPRLVSSSI